MRIGAVPRTMVVPVSFVRFHGSDAPSKCSSTSSLVDGLSNMLLAATKYAGEPNGSVPNGPVPNPRFAIIHRRSECMRMQFNFGYHGVYSTCSMGLAAGTPLFHDSAMRDVALLTLLPVMIITISLPEVQPARVVISATTEEMSGVL